MRQGYKDSPDILKTICAAAAVKYNEFFYNLLILRRVRLQSSLPE